MDYFINNLDSGYKKDETKKFLDKISFDIFKTIIQKIYLNRLKEVNDSNIKYAVQLSKFCLYHITKDKKKKFY